MRSENRIIIWPVYLDLNRTRQEGRLASEESSVKSPKVSEIVRAADKLGLNPEADMSRKHPSSWGDQPGMVMVDNVGPKSDIVRRIGAEIIRNRGGKQ